MKEENQGPLAKSRTKTLLVLYVLLKELPTEGHEIGPRAFVHKANELVGPRTDSKPVIRPSTPEKSLPALNAFFDEMGWDCSLKKNKKGIYFTTLPALAENKEPTSDFDELLLEQCLEDKPTVKTPLTLYAMKMYAKSHHVVFLKSPSEIVESLAHLNALFAKFKIGYHLTSDGKGHYYFDTIPLQEREAEIVFDLLEHTPLLNENEKDHIRETLTYLTTSNEPAFDYQKVLQAPELQDPIPSESWYPGEKDPAILAARYDALEKVIKAKGYVVFPYRRHFFSDTYFHFPLYLVKKDADYLLYSLEIREGLSDFKANAEEASVYVQKLSDIAGFSPYVIHERGRYPSLVKAYVERFGKSDADDDFFSPSDDQFDPGLALAYDPALSHRFLSFSSGQWEYEKALPRMRIAYTGNPLSNRLLAAFGVRIVQGSFEGNPNTVVDGKAVGGELDLYGQFNDLVDFAVAASGAFFKVVSPEKIVNLVKLTLEAGLMSYSDDPVFDLGGK